MLRIQSYGLRRMSRKPIQQPPRLILQILELSQHEIRHQFVGHERAAANIVLRFVTDRGAGCYLCSQGVSSRKVAETEISDEPLGQRALAAAGRAEDEGLEGFCCHALVVWCLLGLRSRSVRSQRVRSDSCDLTAYQEAPRCSIRSVLMLKKGGKLRSSMLLTLAN